MPVSAARRARRTEAVRATYSRARGVPERMRGIALSTEVHVGDAAHRGGGRLSGFARDHQAPAGAGREALRRGLAGAWRCASVSTTAARLIVGDDLELLMRDVARAVAQEPGRPSSRHPAIERRARHARPATRAGRGALGLGGSPGPPRAAAVGLVFLQARAALLLGVDGRRVRRAGDGRRSPGRPGDGRARPQFLGWFRGVTAAAARTGARRQAGRPRRDPLGRGRDDRGLPCVHRAHTRWDVRAGRSRSHVTGTKFSAGWDPHERVTDGDHARRLGRSERVRRAGAARCGS